MRTRLIAGAAAVTVLIATAAEVRAQAAADKRVYTVCTLLVGKRNAQRATGTAAHVQNRDGSTITMFAGPSNPLTPSESVQLGKDLAQLQEKLKTTFQLEQIEVVASLADWMTVGREMLLPAPRAGGRLLVTAAAMGGVEPPFVPTTPRGGGAVSGYEEGYAIGRNNASLAAQYNVTLTAGGSEVLDRPMTVRLGTRSVFARQPQPNGPVYFVVVAAPMMETKQGITVGGVVGEPRPIRGPELVSGPDPLLPDDVRARIKGTLILTATIGADGTVRDVTVTQPAEGVTERAVSALRLRKYAPALDENGRPIAVQIVVALQPPAGPESE
ncbi:MAG: energy transducer TonB [Bacteroidales bacterium]